MEIIQKTESFKRIDGKIKFSYVQIFIRQDGILYSGKWTNRFNPPTTGPRVIATWTIYIQAPDLTIYVKTPSLLAYTDEDLESQITREIEACEILRRNPHSNIATHYGYQETDYRVSGLCFKKYTTTLLEAVNPQRLWQGWLLLKWARTSNL
ncbi:uncharacterized protein N7483_003107 [Penicillium malachiteum]|uniref:uncharacterized protein n=1 Tax=Penicillium malachiteum TaxID=1324776 RepID=UPI002546649B|nr:uncharacterized protein N7483_003107 [Penicillium malachiteum]KAJ5728599.1 hypothetical protein N7483_003107 [Penicillium malachiteum]